LHIRTHEYLNLIERQEKKDKIMKLSRLIHNSFNFPVAFIALTSLFYFTFGLSGSYSAVAFPGTEQIISQLPHHQMTSNKLPKKISTAVVNDAAQRSGVAVADLKITQVTPKNFSNPCVFKFGEVCTREYNPIKGWEVIVQVQQQSWTYHVSKQDSQIILDPKISNTGKT
jgi:hypothetical protein